MAGITSTLRKRRDFQKLYEEGRAYHGVNLVVMIRRTGESPGMLAFVASRRVGSAVRRNRARRILREAFRTLGVDLREEDVHIAFIARATCATVKMQVVRDEMKRILKVAGILRTDTEIDNRPA
ncbi:MAG: ribonuclease P protein component [Candidatus Eisenbacteria bacterium]|uniref:Ribonuclease P protein component n=1 Tax=Eiseniibacteriota bacterium TaxID=2212470 RepID=A0A948W857_UNCEI|nr:ribonuclease P protein component [Candidatus Eisenbacteria bacterium]MBU1950314.1 ribonuclease P protein component [Candidatus Eisenbacteria bacterium]MBU2693324.1 ribonuclease P protein component [Candidatus Eisenbacteria bacterium]